MRSTHPRRDIWGVVRTMRAAAQIILWAAETYLVVGAILALGFVWSGLRRALPQAGHITLGARVIILPAEGPMSTPRRLAPMSSGTPITRIRRVGSACMPLYENADPSLACSALCDIQKSPAATSWSRPQAAQTIVHLCPTGGAVKLHP